MSRFPRNPPASHVAETLDRLITLEPPQNGGRRPALRGIPPEGVGRLSGTARRRVPGVSLGQKLPLRASPERVGGFTLSSVEGLTLPGCSLNVLSIIRIVATGGSAHA